MKQDEAVGRLQNLVETYESGLPGRINAVRERMSKGQSGSVWMMLETTHRLLAMKSKYIECDDAQFRQHMHVACKLKIESIRLDAENARYETGVELWHALLSDSPDVIDAMARLEPAYFVRHRDAPLNPQFIVHMWQLAILGDDEALAEKVQNLAKNGRKPWRKDCAEGVDFFSLLMHADKAALEARITKDVKLRNDDPITGDFFTYLATFEAKLCWYRGIEVQIDSPRVPADLMPVRPLAHYDDMYDFLQPGWVPPPQGLLSKVGRWFGRGDR